MNEFLSKETLSANNSEKFNGFTLAEVLITLGIIGVVTAMTLPSVINNSRNKQLETALNKNYSVIQQALSMYQAETGMTLKGKEIDERQLKPLILKYFSVLRDCGFGSMEEDACVPNMGATNTVTSYKTYNGNRIRLNFFDDGQFLLTDGSLIMLKNNLYGDHVYISVDVNGQIKGPNKWGHDLFTFQLMPTGSLLPIGAEGTKRSEEETFCSVNSTSEYNGIACAYKALTDKNYFQNLPK